MRRSSLFLVAYVRQIFQSLTAKLLALELVDLVAPRTQIRKAFRKLGEKFQMLLILLLDVVRSLKARKVRVPIKIHFYFYLL